MGLRNEVEGLIAQFGKDFDNQDSASVANFYAQTPSSCRPGLPWWKAAMPSERSSTRCLPALRVEVGSAGPDSRR